METYITCDFPEGLLYQDILGACMISDAAICTYDRVFKPYTEKQKFSLSAYIMSVDVAFLKIDSNYLGNLSSTLEYICITNGSSC